MKTRLWLLTAGLCSTGILISASAQTGGSAGAGSAGAATASPASSATPPAAAAAGTSTSTIVPTGATNTATAVPTGATSATSPIPGAPMSTGGQVIQGAAPGIPGMGASAGMSADAQAAANATTTQTPGTVGALSGVPLPTQSVSPGTAPIGPQPLATGRTDEPVLPTTAPQATGQSFARTSVFVPTPPPQPLADTRIAAASANQVWVPGHYSWVNGQWTWAAGNWTLPPAPGALWVQGTYNAQTQQWTEGHWEMGAAPRTQ